MAEEQTIDYKAEYENAQKEIESLKTQLKYAREERERKSNLAHNQSEYQDRVSILKCMEKLVRNINNGDFIEDWLMNGFPDDGSEEDYLDMARDPGLYLGAVEAFLRIMHRSESTYDYFPFSHWGEKDCYGCPVKHSDWYSEDIYGHKLSANKYMVKVRIPGDRATWRLKCKEDVDKVLEILGTLDEVNESEPIGEEDDE